MARDDLSQKLMADVTMALEHAHDAAAQAQSPTLPAEKFEQLVARSIANARRAVKLAETAVEAHLKNARDS